MSDRIISVVNQKGGTGKTTTTVNMGCALANLGFKVLLIDLDPQGNLSYSLAINSYDYTINNVLSGEVDVQDSITKSNSQGPDVIPSDVNLAQFDNYARQTSSPEFILNSACKQLTEYDYILIDCPPSLSLLTINALIASDFVLVPMQLDVFSIQGLSQIMATVSDVNDSFNHDLQFLGVLPVMVDKRRKLTEEVLEHTKENFNIYVFDNHIRSNVKAAEAPSFGQSVVDYAPLANSAKDYNRAAKELLKVVEQKSIGIEY